MIRVLAVALTLATLASLPYLRSLNLPWISDDYLLIIQTRDWGPASGWPHLAQDALYRTRALSFVFHHWLKRLFGESPFNAHLFSLAWHIVVCWSIALLGSWRLLGWRVSVCAAAFFALYEGHQEAVIWYSALPDLQSCLIVVLCALAYIQWAQTRRSPWYIAALALFLAGLVAKEAAVAVIPILLWIGWRESGMNRRLVLSLLPMVLIAVVYTVSILTAGENHLHLKDGTFSLSAPFLRTWVISFARLFWFWGFAALILVFQQGKLFNSKPLHFGLYWIAVTLPPYCFLLYMPRIPSRHTYLPSVGLAIVCGVAMAWIWHNRRTWVPAVATALILHNAGYVLWRKHQQFAVRAAPTEALVQYVRQTAGAFVLVEFPYNQQVAADCLRIHLPGRETDLRWSPGQALAGLPSVQIQEDGAIRVH